MRDRLRILYHSVRYQRCFTLNKLLWRNFTGSAPKGNISLSANDATCTFLSRSFVRRGEVDLHIFAVAFTIAAHN
jgi:hypothetical protein